MLTARMLVGRPTNDASRTFLFGRAINTLVREYETTHAAFEQFLHSRVMMAQYRKVRKNPVIMTYAQHKAKHCVKKFRSLKTKLRSIETYGLNPNTFPTYKTLTQELDRDLNHWANLAEWFQYQGIVATTR